MTILAQELRVRLKLDEKGVLQYLSAGFLSSHPENAEKINVSCGIHIRQYKIRNTRHDEELATQQTLTPGDLQDQHRRPLSQSVNMSSSVIDSFPLAGIFTTQDESVEHDTSLVTDATEPHLARATRSTLPHEDMFVANLDFTGSDEHLPHVIGCAVDARASSPSPIYGRGRHRRTSPFRCDSVEMTSINLADSDLSFRHLHDTSGRLSTHSDLPFRSPNLSPIFPTSFIPRPPSPIPPGDDDDDDNDNERRTGSFRLPTPAACLFGNPSRPASPILVMPFVDLSHDDGPKRIH
ncbi:unnamed protein product [Echinostoma caproni]|uniref:Velvet domain-containing protein n=1 Tax=Echinostoma caproni TaxID=27848 RepID=A0A183AHV3_9TREM|nr:unnamed protein product [Echinostoma caproni]